MIKENQSQLIQQLESIDKALTSRINVMTQGSARLEENIAILKRYLLDKKKHQAASSAEQVKQITEPINTVVIQNSTTISEDAAVGEHQESTEEKLNRILSLAKQIRSPQAKGKRDADDASVSSSISRASIKKPSSSSSVRKPESLRSAFIKASAESQTAQPPPSPEPLKATLDTKPYRTMAVNMEQSSLPAPPSAALQTGAVESPALVSIRQQLSLLRTRRPLLHNICHAIMKSYSEKRHYLYSHSPSILLKALAPHSQQHWQQMLAQYAECLSIEALQKEQMKVIRAISQAVEGKTHRKNEQEMMQLVGLWYQVAILHFIGSKIQSLNTAHLHRDKSIKINIRTLMPLSIVDVIEKVKTTNSLEQLIKIKQKWKKTMKDRLDKFSRRNRDELFMVIEQVLGTVCLPYVALCFKQLQIVRRGDDNEEQWRIALKFLRSLTNALLYQAKKANCICFLPKN